VNGLQLFSSIIHRRKLKYSRSVKQQLLLDIDIRVLTLTNPL